MPGSFQRRLPCWCLNDQNIQDKAWTWRDMMTADTPLIKDTNDWYKPIPLLVTKFNSICWMKYGIIMFFKNHNGRWAWVRMLLGTGELRIVPPVNITFLQKWQKHNTYWWLPRLQGTRWRGYWSYSCLASAMKILPDSHHPAITSLLAHCIDLKTRLSQTYNIFCRKNHLTTFLCKHLLTSLQSYILHLYYVWALKMGPEYGSTFENPNQLESPRNENARSLCFQCPQVICSMYVTQSQRLYYPWSAKIA